MSANIDELKGIKATEGMLGCVLRDARSKGKTKKKQLFLHSTIRRRKEIRQSEQKDDRQLRKGK